MDSIILKFILENQGAVDTDYLKCNLASDDAIDHITNNHEKFALCCPFGKSKVVARTRLKMCRTRECPGSCHMLHLCKKFLLTGNCPFSTRCKFSHELDSDYNMALLRLNGLESLSRTELRTLLLQTDNFLLPDICHNFNNGGGEFGLCQDGYDCKRLHMCERYMNRDCSCSKTHEFTSAQPYKCLQGRGVPDDLIPSLRSVYANIMALKYSDRKSSAAPNNTDVSSDDGLNSERGQCYRGRGGNRGNRGKRGKRSKRGKRGNSDNQDNNLPAQRTTSPVDLSLKVDDFELYTEDGQSDEPSLKSEKLNRNKTSTVPTGRGSNSGTHDPLKQTCSADDILGASGAAGPSTRPRPVREKTEICIFFIKGHCKHNEQCFKVHDKMPYKWEVREGDRWAALPDNEEIEKHYCDPKNTYSGSPPVHFDTMTCGLDKVRRLSTANSLLEPTFIHTTEWVWYWEDESGNWIVYSSAGAGHKTANMDSATLEQRFLSNDKGVVDFTAGSQSYSLSFKDMIQTNKEYGTKKLVKRRPQFVSATDVLTRRVRRPQTFTNISNIPDNWDRTQIPQTGFMRVPVLRSSDEFKGLETLFCQSLRGFDIVKIERIQNKALWELFQWQKNQMKSKNQGRNVTEKLLFHGTHPKYVDVICRDNFDWRVCGVNGTVFGQGSYFARDAKYSHSYTGDADVKSMFISRVLVGSYTKGHSSYRRAPSKDGGDINYFNSCVDDVMDPSIFVVFDMPQIYPEYLLQYKAAHPLVSKYATAAAPLVRPAPIPTRLSTSVSSPSTSTYKSSTYSYQTPPPSYYQPAPKPPPPSPKKNDSCAIS